MLGTTRYGLFLWPCPPFVLWPPGLQMHSIPCSHWALPAGSLGPQGLRAFLRVWVATSRSESTNRHQVTPLLPLLPPPPPCPHLLRHVCPGGISTRVGELVRPLRTNSFREVWLMRPLKGDNMGVMPLKGPKSHATLGTLPCP